MAMIFVITRKPLKRRILERFENGTARMQHVKVRLFRPELDHPELGYSDYYLDPTSDQLVKEPKGKVIVTERDGYLIFTRSDGKVYTFSMMRDGMWIPRGWATLNSGLMHVYGVPKTGRSIISGTELYYNFQGMLPSEGLMIQALGTEGTRVPGTEGLITNMNYKESFAMKFPAFR